MHKAAPLEANHGTSGLDVRWEPPGHPHGYLALRFSALGAARRSRWLLAAAGTWGLYAAWEWLVLVRSPEANIRVDLLIIWPALAILSAWALFRALR